MKIHSVIAVLVSLSFLGGCLEQQKSEGVVGNAAQPPNSAPGAPPPQEYAEQPSVVAASREIPAPTPPVTKLEPWKLRLSFERVFYDNTTHEATEEDWRNLALLDLKETVGDFHLRRCQGGGLSHLLASRKRNNVAAALSVLLDRPLEDLFPENLETQESRLAFGFLLMLSVKSHYPSFPVPVNGRAYTKEDIPVWRKWWSENKDKLPYVGP